MTAEQQLELAIYAKVYEAILLAPITSAFREDAPGADDEAPPVDPEMVVAITADRFGLMTRIREMRIAAAGSESPNADQQPEPRIAFCPACFVEVTPEQADAQTAAARVLAEFAKTAPGRLPSRVQEAIAVVDGVPSSDGRKA